MKKLLLLLFTITSLGLTSRAQTFENTVWNISYMGFEVGTVSFEGGLMLMLIDGTWAPIGQYTLSGNMFSITMPSDCPETGTYSYVISGNELQFTLINDPCEDRDQFFVTPSWLASGPTSIASTSAATSFEIYPNPSNGELYVTQAQPDQLHINVYNMMGEMVHQERFNDLRNQLDLGSLAKGGYVIQGITERGTATRKIIVE